MSQFRRNQSNQQIPLRLWPGVVIVLLQWILRFVVPIFFPGAIYVGVFGALGCGLLLILWWLFFSRAFWSERLGGVALMIGTLVGMKFLLHESIATSGMGMTFVVYAIPVLCLAFVLWAMTCRRRAGRPKWASMFATIVLSCGVWTLVRTGGFTSDFDQDFAWRWSQTPEEKLLAQSGNEPSITSSATAFLGGDIKWPGFRGVNRDSTVHGVFIKTDWESSPPVELWRRPVGPGWSSFAVQGDLFYTQEQRGDDEVVACYSLTTGQPVWKHGESTRFWEANAGAGPRGTPLLSGGRVYALGATGILTALNAADGSLIWSRNVAMDTGAKTPVWGFSGSPLVFEDAVLVAAAGTLAAYDTGSGDLRWFGPDGKDGYSSPHLMTIDGVDQVLLMSKTGAVGISPNDGSLLWKYARPGGSRIVQPASIENGELLMSRGETTGLSRITVSHETGDWIVEERWTTNRMKPYFSDFVVHKGHVYGFDGNRLVAFNIEETSRTWKGRRYGSGQLLLLADQDLLLIVSEQGELALANASSDKFTEIARFPAIEGKTWNHPVLAGDVLLVRNDHEMVAFRLALVDG